MLYEFNYRDVNYITRQLRSAVKKNKHFYCLSLSILYSTIRYGTHIQKLYPTCKNRARTKEKYINGSAVCALCARQQHFFKLTASFTFIQIQRCCTAAPSAHQRQHFLHFYKALQTTNLFFYLYTSYMYVCVLRNKNI